MTSTPEPIGEHNGVPQYAQAITGEGQLVVASTPPAIYSDAEAEAAAEAEAGG